MAYNFFISDFLVQIKENIKENETEKYIIFSIKTWVWRNSTLESTKSLVSSVPINFKTNFSIWSLLFSEKDIPLPAALITASPENNKYG